MLNLMRVRAIIITALCSLLASCSTDQQNSAAGIGGIALASMAPSDNILQTYYLGVLDPLDQIPQTVYRIRVRGQASLLS